MWKYTLSLPPDDYETCEEWLTEADALNGTRNFAKDWVKVHSSETTVYPCNDVACHYMENTKDVECDADIVGSDKTCNLRVKTQLEPWDPAPLVDSMSLVTLGPSLDYDVSTGLPQWTEYSFLSPPNQKRNDSVIVAVLEECKEMENKMDIIREFTNLGSKIEMYGKCFNRSLPDSAVNLISSQKFALFFEDYASQGYMSRNYWNALVAGTVPIIVANAKVDKFVPAQNAYLQVARVSDVSKVASWVAYLSNSTEAYSEMLKWKTDWPSDPFLATLDLTSVQSECRLCLHIATRLLQQELVQREFPCRCQDPNPKSTSVKVVYHLFLRERGKFNFHPLFLKSDQLSIAHLVKAIYRVFKSVDNKPVWLNNRPESLTSSAGMFRAYRVYPIGVPQAMAMSGVASFKNDQQFRSFVEASPCPLLEVIFL